MAKKDESTVAFFMGSAHVEVPEQAVSENPKSVIAAILRTIGGITGR